MPDNNIGVGNSTKVGSTTNNSKFFKRTMTSKMNGATDRGTKIVKKNEIDKNTFLRILTAQLQNQDPFNAKDGTEYVSQLAQFASMEQITNLNSTMTASSAYGLVGKTVAFNSYDMYGHQYGGVVQDVIRQGDNIKLEVDVLENGKYVPKEFDLKDVSDVINAPDQNYNINNNINFLLSSSLIGKSVEVALKDGVYSAKVNSVYKDGANINLNVDIENKFFKGEMKPSKGFSSEKVGFDGKYSGDKGTSLNLRYVKAKDVYEYSFGDEDKWNEYKAGSEVNGIKFTLPKNKPSNDVQWSATITGITKDNLDVSSDNILVIKK